MFFALQVKSSHKQPQHITLDNNLKLTQACLEPSKNGKKEPVCLVMEYQEKQCVLCVLDPNLSWQTPLDVVIDSGSELKFSLRGAGTVHLIGYEIQDEFDDISVSMSDDDEEITSDEGDETEMELTASGRKKPKELPMVNGKAKKNGLPSKKAKISPMPVDDDDDDDDDDDSDDLDFDSDASDLSIEGGSSDDEEDDDEEVNADDEDNDEELSDTDSDMAI